MYISLLVYEDRVQGMFPVPQVEGLGHWGIVVIACIIDVIVMYNNSRRGNLK